MESSFQREYNEGERAQQQGELDLALEVASAAEKSVSHQEEAGVADASNKKPMVECSICLDDITGPFVRPCGEHPMHVRCGVDWARSCRNGQSGSGHSVVPTCPVCRTEFKESDLLLTNGCARPTMRDARRSREARLSREAMQARSMFSDEEAQLGAEVVGIDEDDIAYDDALEQPGQRTGAVAEEERVQDDEALAEQLATHSESVGETAPAADAQR